MSELHGRKRRRTLWELFAHPALPVTPLRAVRTTERSQSAWRDHLPDRSEILRPPWACHVDSRKGKHHGVYEFEKTPSGMVPKMIPYGIRNVRIRPYLPGGYGRSIAMPDGAVFSFTDVE